MGQGGESGRLGGNSWVLAEEQLHRRWMNRVGKCAKWWHGMPVTVMYSGITGTGYHHHQRSMNGSHVQRVERMSGVPSQCCYYKTNKIYNIQRERCNEKNVINQIRNPTTTW